MSQAVDSSGCLHHSMFFQNILNSEVTYKPQTLRDWATLHKWSVINGIVWGLCSRNLKAVRAMFTELPGLHNQYSELTIADLLPS